MQFHKTNQIPLRPAVFLDRDGVINELIVRDTYEEPTSPFNLSEFKYLPNVREAVCRFKDAGFLVFVVTNQPHVGNEMTTEEFKIICRKMADDLPLDGIAYCKDKNSTRYKPNTCMFEQIKEDLNIDMKNSFMVGDRWKDIVPAHKMKLTTVFIGDKYECPDEYKKIKPNHIADDILSACDIILEKVNARI